MENLTLGLFTDAKRERRRRTELLQFYGAGKEDTPYDINSKHFNNDMYIQKVIKVSKFKLSFL